MSCSVLVIPVIFSTPLNRPDPQDCLQSAFDHSTSRTGDPVFLVLFSHHFQHKSKVDANPTLFPRFHPVCFFGSFKIVRPALPSPAELFAPSTIRPLHLKVRGAFSVAGTPFGMFPQFSAPPSRHSIFLPLVYCTSQRVLTPPISQNPYLETTHNLATSLNHSLTL